MSTPLVAFRDRLRWFGHRLTASAFVAEVLPGAAAKTRAYLQLTRLDRPIGIWLLLWPVLWAMWLASDGHPDPHVFIVFVLGVVLTRSAGCAINDYADCKTYIADQPNSLGVPLAGPTPKEVMRRSDYDVVVYSYNPFVETAWGPGYDCSSQKKAVTRRTIGIRFRNITASIRSTSEFASPAQNVSATRSGRTSPHHSPLIRPTSPG